MAQVGASEDGGRVGTERQGQELGLGMGQKDKAVVQTDGEASGENQRTSSESDTADTSHQNLGPEGEHPGDETMEEQRKEREDHIAGTNPGELVQAMMILKDAMVGASQQRTPANTTPTPVTPMLPIVTAMKNLKTPYFEGTEDPIEADQWLRKMEKNLETAMCPENLKKRIGVYYLDKDAAEWWDSREKQLNQPVTWSIFKTEFEKKYFTPEARIRLQRQFLNLKQGDKTVRAYESEFMRLRRHAIPGQDDDKAMITHFLFGVRPELESRLAVGTYANLTELIEKAVNVESGLNAEKEARKAFFQDKKGRNMSGPSGHRNKGKGPTVNMQKNWTSFGGECRHCGRKGHKEQDCWSKNRRNGPQGFGEVTCYVCNQKGHISRYCPKRAPIPARPVNTRPAQAPLAIEPAPKRQAIEGRVYALERDNTETPGPAQGPVAGRRAV